MGQVKLHMVPIHISEHTPMVLSHRAMAYRTCNLLNTMNLQTSPMGGFWEVSWDRDDCLWYLQTLINTLPLYCRAGPWDAENVQCIVPGTSSPSPWEGCRSIMEHLSMHMGHGHIVWV
jgi:hypothetical protein